MELRELRSFCTAAKLRSISKAAEVLRIGQPTATTHIKNLESELGTRLFDRVKRPIQLTLAGATLAKLATPLVEGIDALASRTSMAEEEGPVYVAADHDLIPHTLVRVVREFRARYLHVHLRIRSALRDQVLQLVEDGDVDVGVVSRPEFSDKFDFQGLFGYDRVLITPLGHPLARQQVSSLEQIARYPLIMRTRSYTRDLLEAGFRRRGIPYDIVVELDTMDMIKKYVALGMGVSVGARLAIDPEDERILGIVSLATLLPVDKVGYLTLRGKTLSRPARDFMAVMKDVLAPAAARP